MIAHQAILKKRRVIYESLMKSNQETHHEVCKVLKQNMNYGFCYKRLKKKEPTKIICRQKREGDI